MIESSAAPFTTRRAVPADAEAIVDLHRENLLQTYPQGSDITAEAILSRYNAFGSHAERVERWRQAATNHQREHLVVADVSGEVAGFAHCRVVEGQRRIDGLYVDLAHMGQKSAAHYLQKRWPGTARPLSLCYRQANIYQL